MKLKPLAAALNTTRTTNRHSYCGYLFVYACVFIFLIALHAKGNMDYSVGKNYGNLFKILFLLYLFITIQLQIHIQIQYNTMRSE